MKPIINVLIIEDNLSDIELVKYELKKSSYNYNIFEADSFSDSILKLHKENIDIILLEYNIFGRTAVDLLKKIKQDKIDIPSIVFSSMVDDDKIIKCFDLGVSDYINKKKFNKLPHSIETILLAEKIKSDKEVLNKELSLMKHAIDISHEIIVILNQDLKIIYFNNAFLKKLGYNKKEVINSKISKFMPINLENMKFRDPLKQCYNLSKSILIKTKDNSKLYIKYSIKKFKSNSQYSYILQVFDLSKAMEYQEKLLNKEIEVEETLLSTLEVLSTIIRFNDPYTGDHQNAVSNFSVKISRELGLSLKEELDIKYAALLHDIGKLSIPISILVKPGTLTNTEFNFIKKHSEISYEIIKKIRFNDDVKIMALQHHERLNGSGYPKGLKGNEILLGSKIIAVADVVHAMSSRRPYRDALGIDLAVQELLKNRGILYSKKVVDAALTVIRRSKNNIFD